MKTRRGEGLIFPVAEFGDWLMARDTGGKVCLELERHLRDADPVTEVTIDFHGVQAMTFSFADEFLGRFMSMRASALVPPVGIILTGLNDDTAETVALVLERRSLFAVRRERELDDLVLLGADDQFATTFQVAVELADFKASDLAVRLGISPQNANNRLKKLSAAGAVQRERATADRGGKEFSYRAVL